MVKSFYLNSKGMCRQKFQHARLWEELLECEALVLDGLAKEDGEVAVQRDVERGLVNVGLRKESNMYICIGQ